MRWKLCTPTHRGGRLLVAVLVAGLALGGCGRPRSQPEPARFVVPPDQAVDRSHASIVELRRAIGHALSQVEAGRWDEAEAAARNVRDTWFKVKPQMQAGAGHEFWRPKDSSDFETHVQALQRAVARRDAAEARRRLQAMQAITSKYDEKRSDRGTTQRKTGPVP